MVETYNSTFIHLRFPPPILSSNHSCLILASLKYYEQPCNITFAYIALSDIQQYDIQ